MSVSKEEVRRIAELARLRPDEASVERLTRELNGILEHIQRLESLDVSEVDETERISSDPVTFRDPELGPDALGEGGGEGIAPEWRDGFFLVPRLPALDQPNSARSPDQLGSGSDQHGSGPDQLGSGPARPGSEPGGDGGADND